MTPPFTSLGKQILHGTAHYADACDTTAAEVIAAALNSRHQLPQRQAGASPLPPVVGAPVHEDMPA